MPLIRVWDVPVRLIHWSMVVLFAFSWWTAENNNLEWHRYSGYALLALLLFRVYWGFFGSPTARFASFVKGPRAIGAYLRGDGGRIAIPGHNPLGAISVIILLVLLIAQVTLGLFAVDVDGIESGPLSHLVSFDTGRTCADIHETIFNVLLGFIALHIVAVIFYLFRRENLIAGMIHGKRELAPGTPDNLARFSWTMLAVGVMFSGFVTWYLTSG